MADKKSDKSEVSQVGMFQAELDAIGVDDLIDTNAIACGHEKIVGTIPLELRKIWTRVQQTAGNMLCFAGEARKARNAKERTVADAKALEMQEKNKLYANMFWVYVRSYLGIWTGESLGLRKGWKIVKDVHDDAIMPPHVREVFLDALMHSDMPPELKDILKKRLGMPESLDGDAENENNH